MKTYYIIFILLLTKASTSYSQFESANWYFGDSILMNINDGIISTSIREGKSYEASASVSDEKGSLKLYTNGITIWNSLDEIINNGDGLNIAQVEYEGFEVTGSSSTQGVLIINNPGDFSQYYVFTISDSTLSLSIVDIDLFGGSGGVIIKNKTIISDKLMEKMQAVKHGNGTDWWIITHQYGTSPDSSDLFYKVLVSTDTLQVFQQHVGNFSSGSKQGEFAISNSGETLAVADRFGLEILHFDRCNGELVENYFIPSSEISTNDLYGCAFSPDDNKLYVSTLALVDFSELFQFCFNCNDPFIESKKLIYKLVVNISFDSPDYSFGQLESGLDNKLYLVTGRSEIPNNDFSEYTQNLSVINFPNLENIACDLDTNTIWLNGNRATLGLPNMPNYNLGPLVGSACDTLLVIGDNPRPSGIHVYPNPATDQIYFSGNAAYTGSHVQLRIYNLLGEEAFTMSNIPFNTAIQLPELTNGLYEVVLENGKRRLFADELIIQR